MVWIALARGSGTGSLAAPVPVPPLYTEGRSFDYGSRIVSTVVFVWFTTNGGQLTGPWLPVDGRQNWTGEPDWWKSQVKQMMAANIDLIFVHLTNNNNATRANLFQALGEMRAEGYEVPKVAPFFDPPIVWWQRPRVDLGSEAGRDEFFGHYIRFYQDYFARNADPYAESYLARLYGRPILATWFVSGNSTGAGSVPRAAVEDRLRAAFGSTRHLFDWGIYMVVTERDAPTLGFAEEKYVFFSTLSHSADITFNGIRTAQLKPGYWDQNIRTPGSFNARAGGTRYRDAWERTLREPPNRVYIESWNEYDEGTGIYAAQTGPPYIRPGSQNNNSDTWSDANNPFEYIQTTAAGARAFNDAPDLAARILWYDLPVAVQPGETHTARVVVRNEGDIAWTGAAGFAFGQREPDAGLPAFCPVPVLVNDTSDEIAFYGGIFRGRPLTFEVPLVAPMMPGCYATRWSMRNAGGWFGEELRVEITVAGEPCDSCPTCPPSPTETPRPTATPTWATRTPTPTLTATHTNTPRPRTPTFTPTLVGENDASLVTW